MEQQHDSLVAFGDTIRAITTEGAPEGLVGGYLVPFTGPEQKDLYGTYFTPNTYYGKLRGDGMDVLIHHGKPIRGVINGEIVEFPELAGRSLTNAMTTRVDDVGIWAEVILNMADDYEKQVHQLVKQDKLRWSSGALAHTVDIDPETGEVRKWMIGEGSLTPTPGTPENRTRIVTIRSLDTIATMTTPIAPALPQSRATAAPVVPAAPTAAATKPAVRADLLGDWLESSIAVDSLCSVNQALYWRISSIIYDYDKSYSVDEQLALIPAYFDEHKDLCMRILTAILTATDANATVTAEAIRSLFPKETAETRAAKVLAATHYDTLVAARDGIDAVLAAHKAKESKRSEPDVPAVPVVAVVPETPVAAAATPETPAPEPAATPDPAPTRKVIRFTPEMMQSHTSKVN